MERGVLFSPVDNHRLVALGIFRAAGCDLIYVIASDSVRFDPEHLSVNTRQSDRPLTRSLVSS